MSTANSIDTARLNLLLNELRLPAIKVLWPQFAEQSDKEGWPAAAFGDLPCPAMVARKRAAGQPSLSAKLRPQQLDGWQPQLVEQQIEARGVNGVGRAHAAPPISPAPTRHS
ncbi:hypothetical protein ACVWZV_007178 [Bradyrhizobium sp. GM5.1]